MILLEAATEPKTSIRMLVMGSSVNRISGHY
jgi:hypothetical protein